MSLDLIFKVYNEFKFYIFKTFAIYNMFFFFLISLLLSWYFSVSLPIVKFPKVFYGVIPAYVFNFIINFVLYLFILFFAFFLFVYFINKKRLRYKQKNVFIPFSNILAFKDVKENHVKSLELNLKTVLVYNKLSIEGVILNAFKKIEENNICNIVIWDNLLLPTKDAILFYTEKYNIRNIFWLDFDIFWKMSIKSYYYDPFIINLNYALAKIDILDEDNRLLSNIENSIIALSIWKSSFEANTTDQIKVLINLTIEKLSTLLTKNSIYFYYIYLFLLIHIIESNWITDFGKKYLIFIKSAANYFSLFMQDDILNKKKIGDSDYNLFHLYGYSLYFYYKSYPNFLMAEYRDFVKFIKKVMLVDNVNSINCIGRYWLHYLYNPELFNKEFKDLFKFNDNKFIVQIVNRLNLTNKWHISFLIAILRNWIIEDKNTRSELYSRLSSANDFINILLKSNYNQIDSDYKKYSDNQLLLIQNHIENLIKYNT